MDAKIDTLKSEISTKAHEGRVRTLEKICRALAHPGRSPFAAMMDPAFMEAAIDAQPWAKTTQKMYWVTLFYIAKAQDADFPRREELIEAYREKFLAINKELLAKELTQEPSEKQKAAWMDYEAIQAFGTAFVQRTDVPLDDRIVVGLYTLLPPARLDYTDLEIRNSRPALGEETPNHVYVGNTDDGGYVFIGKHKTSKTSGALQHSLPPSLCSLFRQYQLENPGKPCLACTPNRLGKRLTTLFVRYSPEKKSVTANIIRHAKATKDCTGMPPLRNLLHDARAMAHDPVTHLLYSKKI